MIKYFSNKSITVFIAVLVIGAMVRVPGIVWGYSPGSIRSGALQEWFVWLQQYPWLSASLAWALTLWQGFALNALAQRTGIVPSSSGYTLAFVYVCMASFYPVNLYVGNVVLANTLFVLGLGFLSSQTQSQQHPRSLFYVSLLFGVASMIVPETYWLFVYLILAVLVFKTIQINDVLAISFGMGMPFFFLYSLHELSADAESTWRVSSIFQVPDSQFARIHWAGEDVLPLLLACGLGLLGLIRSLFSYYKNNTETRRSLLLMALFTGFAIILLLLRWESLPQFYLILLIPMALFSTSALLSIRRTWLGSTMLFSLLLLQQVSLHHRHWALLETIWSWVMPF